ncbi:MAG TPA: YkvA family protein [Coriobacteriia bacterium]
MQQKLRPTLNQRLRGRATALRHETHALVLAYADPRTPWIARLIVVATVAYALSPIDLIPDPIPVLGYLDDLLIVPAGIALAIRLIPAEVMVDARKRTANPDVEASLGRWGAAIVVAVWIAALALAGSVVWRAVRR